MKKQVFTRILSSDGEKEVGHIFKEGVPVQSWTPFWANLRGERGLVFLVDWQSLSDNQQSLALQYMSEKFGAPQEVIRKDIEADGYFPIRQKWVIESYELRSFM